MQHTLSFQSCCTDSTASVHLSIFLSSHIYHILTWHCQLYKINKSLNPWPQLPLHTFSPFPVGLSAVSSNLLPFANLCPPLARIQHACPEKLPSYTFPLSSQIVIPSFPSPDEVILTSYCHMLLKPLSSYVTRCVIHGLRSFYILVKCSKTLASLNITETDILGRC